MHNRRLHMVAIGAAVVVAIGGTLAGWRLAGPTETETTLGRVSFEVAPHAFGAADAFVPIADWGLRADAFDSLFKLNVEVRAVDRRGAVTAASGDAAVLDGLERDLEDGAKAAVVRALAWGLASALVCATLLWLGGRRSTPIRRGAYAGALAAAAIAGGSALAASTTFDAKAFNDPAYYGRGQELAQLLAFLERQRENDRYTATFANALANFTAYLSEAPRVGDAPGRDFAFGSDLHNNALIVSSLAGFVEDNPFLLAGDFGHEGNEAEARLIAPRLAALSDRVIAVSGNHDSAPLMRAIVRNGVTVLTQDGRLRADGDRVGSPVIRVRGLAIAGFSDPLEWQGPDPGSPARVFSFPELEDGDELEAEAKNELVTWFLGLTREPDVVLVHQNALAQHLAAELAAGGYERPLVIVTGHNHYQQIDRYGSVVVVNAGTLGAGGVLRVGQEAAGLGLMHFVGAEPKLRSVDLIEIQPLSGQASADRAVIDVVCPPGDTEDQPCHYEPGGL